MSVMRYMTMHWVIMYSGNCVYMVDRRNNDETRMALDICIIRYSNLNVVPVSWTPLLRCIGSGDEVIGYDGWTGLVLKK